MVFIWIWSIKKIILFAVFLCKTHTWEKSSSWDIGQNALDQSDCKIFKLTMSLKQNHDFLHVDADS